MKVAVRVLVLVLLSLAVWKVHEARARLRASGVGDPARIARMQARLDAIPLDLAEAGWRGAAVPVRPEEALRYGTECFVRNRYENEDGASLTLYVAGAATFNEWFHTPNFCLIASGWELRDYDVVDFFALPDSDTDASMTRVVTEHGYRRMVVYYWVQAASTVLEAKWGRRVHRFLDLLAGREPTATYMVVLYVPASADSSVTDRMATSFMSVLMPHLVAATTEVE